MDSPTRVSCVHALDATRRTAARARWPAARRCSTPPPRRRPRRPARRSARSAAARSQCATWRALALAWLQRRRRARSARTASVARARAQLAHSAATRAEALFPGWRTCDALVVQPLQRGGQHMAASPQRSAGSGAQHEGRHARAVAPQARALPRSRRARRSGGCQEGRRERAQVYKSVCHAAKGPQVTSLPQRVPAVRALRTRCAARARHGCLARPARAARGQPRS